MSEISKTQIQMHVAVFAFPFGSHAAPLLNLITRLSKSSPDVKFSFLCTNSCNKSLFNNKQKDFDDEKLIKPYNISDGLPEGFVYNALRPHEPVEYFLKSMEKNFKKGLEEVEIESGLKISCLITDAFFWFASEMAQNKLVPWLPLWTAAPRSLITHVQTDFIRQNLQINASKEQTLDFLPGFSTIRVDDLPEGLIKSENAEPPIAQMLHKMGQTLPQANAVILNSFENIDPEIENQLKSKFQKFLCVGPFSLTIPTTQPSLITDKHGCLEWLDKQKTSSVVYISFGTVITPPPHEISALAEAIEESEFPFLWSFRGNANEILPKGFLERTSSKCKVIPWAPQVQVLQHASVGVFLSHGGWNSILDTIIGAVPIICRPFFGDQKLNARSVETVWRIGLEVEERMITKSGVLKAIQQILLYEGNDMRERIKVVKKFAHDAVESNGSSTHHFNSLVEIVTKLSQDNV